MTDRKVMIQLNHVDKVYRLGEVGRGTLQEDLQSWWALRRGREDPNSKIGEASRMKGTRFYALEDVDLTVYQGECLGIIGGNGAGKSTLLKLISRVTAPTGGSIDLYGRVTSMLEVGTGFHGEMTGIENIYLNGAILGMNRKEIDAVLEQIIDFSEVWEFINTPVKRYSSGMYVKLAFSVAAHLNSEIVIMDEVLAVGDIAFQKKCIQRMLSAARDENRTILYVSHNMNTIRELCDRCIVMDQGHICFDGEVEEAIRFYSELLTGEQSAQKDLTNAARSGKGLTGNARIVFSSVENQILHMGDPLDFRLTVRSKEPLPKAQLRLVVSNSAGEIVGMTYSDPMVLEEGVNELDCRFDTGMLSPGAWFFDIALFEFENEAQIRHDFVRRAVNFHIEENRRYFGQPWKRYSWGSVLFPPLTAGKADNDE